MDIEIAPFDPSRDRQPINAFWEEIGWLDPDRAEQVEAHDLYLACGRSIVARWQGRAESVATSAAGSIRYLDRSLSAAGIIAVSTSRVARKRGLASRATARLVAEEAAAGAAVCGLGVFDQGYYDRLGFGSAAYRVRVAFDPQDLDVAVPGRPPCRLNADDWEALHACRMARAPAHGCFSFDPPQLTRADSLLHEDSFGLGYRDGPQGELTHAIWLRAKTKYSGPYQVAWMAYRSREQLLELLGVLKSLDDQINLVSLNEPPGVQIQDLLLRPFHRRVGAADPLEQPGILAFADHQVRINHLGACLDETSLPCDPLRMNLELSDPIAKYLDDGQSWRGTAGQYVVTLGERSSAEPGRDPALPTLSAGVGAFTRMWLGVRPATGLAVTDQLVGPNELLQQLDAAFRLPQPAWDWPF